MSEARPKGTASAVPDDGSTRGSGEPPRSGAKRFADLVKRAQVHTLVITTVVLAAGLALLWLTKTVVGIESDTVYIALLLAPVIALLAVTGRIQSFQLFGASAVFKELNESITDVGQREPERAAYLAKLGHVLEKDGKRFALIYADVDGLRKVTRAKYLEQDVALPRKREEEIRSEIIRLLEFALTDAFYAAHGDDAKFDVFQLVEPDLAMIVRSPDPRLAHGIAVTAATLFEERHGSSTTTAVLPVGPLRGEVTPQKLDTAAADALAQKKAGPPIGT